MSLFPEISPFATHQLPVGNGHTLYVEQSGNPTGIPVIVLHGGPGSGSKPKHRQIFDPTLYHIIILDQRGAGLSTPHGSLEANTTQHLVEDIETIRTHLGLGQVVLYGSSWGSTLALAYAQTHPRQVLGLVISAIWLGTRRELDWFTHPEGLARFFPAQYAAMLEALGNPSSPEDIFPRLHAALQKDDAHAYTVARAVSRLDALSMDLDPDMAALEDFLNGPDFFLTPIRIWAHYFINDCFLTPHQLLQGAPTIAHLPITIIQAGLDLCCPPETAYALHKALPTSTYSYIHLCGHRANAAMEAARVEATNAMAQHLKT